MRRRRYLGRHRPGAACCAASGRPAIDPWPAAPVIVEVSAYERYRRLAFA